MSADTMKMPDPIMLPMMIVVASNSLSPRISWVPCCIRFSLPQNVHYI
jgi:hypothetical protein